MEGMKSVYEVADYFGVHYQTVNNWIKRGKIKVVRMGRVRRIPESEIRRICKENEVTSVEQQQG